MSCKLAQVSTVWYPKTRIHRFTLTDYETEIEVAFAGVLPDLFKEGQGAVAEGYLRDGRFMAREVLAKHDEKYMPPAVADTLREPRTGI